MLKFLSSEDLYVCVMVLLMAHSRSGICDLISNRNPRFLMDKRWGGKPYQTILERR